MGNPIHATDIRNFLQCRRMFKYGNVERIRLDSYVKPDYFDYGTEGHKILCAHYKGEDVNEIINAIDNEAHADELSQLYRLYKKHYATTDEVLQIAAIEEPINIELKGQPITFTMDLLALARNIGYIIMDHKFLRSFPDENFLGLDFQISFYYWAAVKKGLDIKCFYYNVIKKSIPERPALLKNGTLSTAKTTLNNTEYDLFKEAIEIHGLNPSHYEEALTALQLRGSNVFKRFTVTRTKNELQVFEDQLAEHLDEMLSDKVRYYHNPDSMKCRDCQYMQLCKFEQMGKDTSMLIKGSFVKKEEHER